MSSSPPLVEVAEHVVEFGLVSFGRMRLDASGGAGEVVVGVPPGHCRARLSGFAFDGACPREMPGVRWSLTGACRTSTVAADAVGVETASVEGPNFYHLRLDRDRRKTIALQ